MERHIEHRIVLDDDPKYKNLYVWCLNEVGDGPGRRLTGQIPWSWSVYFKVTELQLIGSISLDPFSEEDEREIVRSKNLIRAKLHPEAFHAGERPTRFSMFGTDRLIQDFTLNIREATEDSQDGCHLWAMVSYTSETDFRNETYPDSLAFDLSVSRERFVEVVRRMEARALAGGMLRVSGVAGFYADRSPEISTSLVKVLTNDTKDHPVEIPEGCQIEPLRTGKVREFDLSLWTEPTPSLPAAGEEDFERSKPICPDAPQAPASPPHPMLPVLRSLRLAAWIVAGLLLLLLLK